MTLIEREEMLHQVLKSSDFTSKNPDLIKSLYRMTSTRDSSERISISSKLRESKISATSLSTNCYESSANNSRGFKIIN